MSTTRTSKQDAELMMEDIKKQYKDMTWFKKVKITSDDHGYSIDLFVNKTEMDAAGVSTPKSNNVKICLYNVQ